MEDKRVKDVNYYIRLIVSNLGTIAAITGVCAVVAVVLLLVLPREYESSVTLLVRPVLLKEPESGSPQNARQAPKPELAEMMPRTLPVETYRDIALSRELISRVRDKLTLEDMSIEQLARNLRVELLQLGERSPTRGTLYSQLMMFYARAKTPQLAADIVREWANLFKQRVDSLMWSGIDESATLMDSMYTSSKSELGRAEDALEKFQKTWNLSLMQQQRTSKETLRTKLEEELDNTEIQIAAAEAHLAALEQELAREERIDTLFKAPPDETFWDQMLNPPESGEAVAITPEVGLRSQQLNPNYTATKNAQVQAKKELDGLLKKRDQIIAKIDELEAEIKQLQLDLAEQEKIHKRLTRDVATFEQTYILVASKKEKAKIAKTTEKTSDIQIAANAVVPQQPVGPRRLVKLVLSVVVSVFLATAYVVARDFFQSVVGTVPSESAIPSS